MKKKFMAIIGTATLAIGLMALPALAGTTQGQDYGWGQMQNYMQQGFNNQSTVPNEGSNYDYGMTNGYGGYGSYGMMGGYSGLNGYGGYGMMGGM